MGWRLSAPVVVGSFDRMAKAQLLAAVRWMGEKDLHSSSAVEGSQWSLLEALEKGCLAAGRPRVQL